MAEQFRVVCDGFREGAQLHSSVERARRQLDRITQLEGGCTLPHRIEVRTCEGQPWKEALTDAAV